MGLTGMRILAVGERGQRRTWSQNLLLAVAAPPKVAEATWYDAPDFSPSGPADRYLQGRPQHVRCGGDFGVGWRVLQPVALFWGKKAVNCEDRGVAVDQL